MMALFFLGLLRMVLEVFVRAIVIARIRGCGLWLLAALWGTMFQVAIAPARWAFEVGGDMAGRVRQQMEDEATRMQLAARKEGMRQEVEDNSELATAPNWAATTWRQIVYGVNYNLRKGVLPGESNPVSMVNLPTAVSSSTS